MPMSKKYQLNKAHREHLRYSERSTSNIHRVRKKGTDSILVVTLTNLGNFSQILARIVLNLREKKNCKKKVPSILARQYAMMT